MYSYILYFIAGFVNINTGNFTHFSPYEYYISANMWEMIFLSSITCAVIFVLLVIFFIILADGLMKKATKRFITRIGNENTPIEAQIRKLLKEYPESEIYIYNITKDEESLEIVKRLSQDFPRLHIKE